MAIIAAQVQLRRRCLSTLLQRRTSGGSAPGTLGTRISQSSTAPSGRNYAAAARKFAADTHHLSREEIKRHGIEAALPPPGTGPGGFWHQRKQLRRESLTLKEMAPLLPLLFMVSMALVLGVMTMYRELEEHPALIVSKKKRREQPLPELDETMGEEMEQRSREFYENSPLRQIALVERSPQRIKQINGKFLDQSEESTGHELP